MSISRLATVAFAATALLVSACDREEADFAPETTTLAIEVDSTSPPYYLTAIFEDPGDGSGTFEPVVSDRAICLLPDSTFVATGALCDLETSAAGITNGTYSLGAMEIYPDPDCGYGGDYELGLEVVGDTLTIWYPCIEGCAARYELL